MCNAAAAIPATQLIMPPVVFIDISQFCHLHAVQTESIKILRDLDPKIRDSMLFQRITTLNTSTLRDFCIKFQKAWALQDRLYRFLVLLMEGPDTTIFPDSFEVGCDSFFVAGTSLDK